MVDSGQVPFGKMDFISIKELLRAGGKLDIEWIPKPMSEVTLKFVDELE